MTEFLVNEDKKEKSDFYTIVGKCLVVIFPDLYRPRTVS